MKFTLSWLKDYLKTDANLEKICETLTMIGLEVEDIQDLSQILAPITVAHVVEVTQHPNADRLKVCQVKTKDGTREIVCGAPNARAGMKAAFAPEGTYIPGLDMTLKKAKIRGVESSGMLCSAKELQVGEDQDGILDLPEDAKVGTPVAGVLGANDPVIEINLTPNRPDCTGVYGIARDLAAAGLGVLQSVKPKSNEKGKPCSIKVKLPHKKACSQFAGRLIKNVKNGPSPDWLQARLKAIGLRPISALVDITNYINFAFGRPLHVYDVKKLKGDIVVTLSKGGEKLDALNDKTYTLQPGMTVITDDSGVIGLGGIVGGESTSVDETTTDVFVECAYFDPIMTATTGRKLDVITDSRYRFERGVDPESIIPGLLHATDMIVKLCGTDKTESSQMVYEGKPVAWQKKIPFDPTKVKNLGGIELKPTAIKKILKDLGFEVTGTDKKLTVVPPSWRPDIDGAADLVEEVLRIHGFDKIQPVSLPSVANIASPLTPLQKRAAFARRDLATRGLLETVTWSFLGKDFARLFGGGEENLTLQNPISTELNQMRPSILPNLILAAQRNADRGYPDAALFEIGPVFNADEEQTLIAGLRFGNAHPRHWAGEERTVDTYDAKADMQAVLSACGAPASAQLTTDAPDYFHPGRSGVLRLGKNILAYFGDLHPAVLQEMDIDQACVGFEVFIENIPFPKQDVIARPSLKLHTLQPLTRDFAFVVDKTVRADEMIRTARQVDKSLIQEAHIFDVYEGQHVEEGKKSIALTVTLQPEDATLTDAQIEEISQRIIAAIQKATGGELRS